MSAVQTAIRDIRDSIQDKASAADKGAPQGLGVRQALTPGRSHDGSNALTSGSAEPHRHVGSGLRRPGMAR